MAQQQSRLTQKFEIYTSQSLRIVTAIKLKPASFLRISKNNNYFEEYARRKTVMCTDPGAKNAVAIIPHKPRV
jgi:hypothetical protein